MVLEKEYPKLAFQDSAFELMRANSEGSARPLSLIPPSTDGYSIPHMEDAVGPSTVIYIRPVQTDLSLDKRIFRNASSPLVTCHSCFQKLPLHVIREHEESCRNLTNVDDDVSISDDSDDSWMSNINLDGSEGDFPGNYFRCPILSTG